MKNILLVIIATLFAASSSAQVLGSYGVTRTASAPVHNPGAQGSKLAYDTTTMTFYFHKSGTIWEAIGKGVDEVTGCLKPNYTPSKYDARLAVSATCDSIWHYRAGAWYCVNPPPIGDGNGIYGGSGVVPAETSVHIPSGIQFIGMDSAAWEASTVGAELAIRPEGGGFSFRGKTPESESNLSITSGLKFNYAGETGDNIAMYAAGQSFTIGAGGPDNIGGLQFSEVAVSGENLRLYSEGSNRFSIIQTGIGFALVSSTVADISVGFEANAIEGYINVIIPESISQGMRYTQDASSTILLYPRSIPDMGTLGLGRVIVSNSSSNANAAAINAGYQPGWWYRWDDGSAIHVMIVR